MKNAQFIQIEKHEKQKEQETVKNADGALYASLLKNSAEDILPLIQMEVRQFFEFAKDKDFISEEPGNTIKIDQFSRDPITMDTLKEIIKKDILAKAIYKARPNYLCFLDNGDNIANIIAAPLISLMQQNMTTHLTDSPGATFNEVSLLLQLRRLVGYAAPEQPKNLLEVGGYFVSGGMMGNMAAVMVARNKLFPNSQQKGLSEFGKAKMILPWFASHYSLWSALGWLGIGEENAIHVDTHNFKYDLIKLRAALQKQKDEGCPVLMVVLSIADSFSMTIDDIKGVYDLCQEYGVWLHGDGANGANVIFSKKHKHLAEHISLCDSVTLDPHKALGLNYPCSIFLCKDVSAFNTVVSHWNIVNRPDSFDLGMLTPFLNSRGFDSLRLWLLIKIFGLDGVAGIIDNKIDATKTIYDYLKVNTDCIRFWNDPQTFSILFQIVPNSQKGQEITALSDDESKELNRYQVDFKHYLLDTTGISIHSFDLPLMTITGNEAEKFKFSTVLAIHNGHESVSHELLDNLGRAINSFNHMKPKVIHD